MQGNVATPSAPPGSAAAAPRKRRFFDMNNTRTFAGMLITPAQLVLLLIIIFPLGLEAYISMTSWTPTKGGNWWEAWQYWVWFENYVDVLTDPAFWQALGRTFLMVGIAVPLEFLLGFGLALLFLDEFRGKAVFHTIFLIPMMIVPAVTGYMFYMLFQSNGPINAILSMVAGHTVTVPWLTSEIAGDHLRHYRRGLAVDAADVSDLRFRADGAAGGSDARRHDAGGQLLAEVPLPDAPHADADHRDCPGDPLHGGDEDLRCHLLADRRRPGESHREFLHLHVQGGLPELPLVLRGRGGHYRARDHDDHRFLRFAPVAFFAGQTDR